MLEVEPSSTSSRSAGGRAGGGAARRGRRARRRRVASARADARVAALYSKGVKWESARRERAAAQAAADANRAKGGQGRERARKLMGGARAKNFFESNVRWEQQRRAAAAALEEASAASALKVCTFHPALPSKPMGVGTGESGTVSAAKFDGAKFYERNKRWNEARVSHIQSLKHNAREEETRNMPFRPFAAPSEQRDAVVVASEKLGALRSSRAKATRSARAAAAEKAATVAPSVPLIPPPARWRDHSAAASANR